MDDIEDILKIKGKRSAIAACNSSCSEMSYTKRHKLRKKNTKSNSGVLVVTVVLAPSQFSCSHDCSYCPNQPGTARSYLDNEPAVARGKQVNYDAIGQMNSRLNTLRENGHMVQKVEIIVLGGTFSDYPRHYQEKFITDLFFAANIYNSNITRDIGTILDEQKINETSLCRIIGISLETRPDKITKHELMRFRKLGCTRVQIGVQHINNTILDGVNRGHTVEQSIKAIALLRNYGFKIDIHVMPDLPGSNPELDKHMLETVLNNGNFSPDYMKIYPISSQTYLLPWSTEKG